LITKRSTRLPTRSWIGTVGCAKPPPEHEQERETIVGREEQSKAGRQAKISLEPGMIVPGVSAMLSRANSRWAQQSWQGIANKGTSFREFLLNKLYLQQNPGSVFL
jgi:hypothetical protein